MALDKAKKVRNRYHPEKLTEEQTTAVWAALDEIAANPSRLQNAERFVSDWTAYKNGSPPYDKPEPGNVNIIRKRMGYGVLRKLMRLAEMSIPELCAICHIDLAEPEGDIAFVYSICNAASMSWLQYYNALAESLTTSWWHTDPSIAGQGPTVRVSKAFYRRSSQLSRNEDLEKMQNANVRHVLSDRNISSRLHLEDLPACAEALQLPLTWILDTPEEVLLFGKNPIVEQIVKAYCFMSDVSKGIFLACLNSSAASSRIKNDRRVKKNGIS